MVLAFFGVADSAYVSQHEATGSPLICNIQSLSGCNTVTSSPYSYVFGISLAEYGIIFYGGIFVLAALELVLVDQFLRRALQGLSIFGLAVSVYSIFLQVFVIRALCVYCLGSALIILLVFIFSSLIEPLHQKRAIQRNTNIPPPSPSLPMPPS